MNARHRTDSGCREKRRERGNRKEGERGNHQKKRALNDFEYTDGNPASLRGAAAEAGKRVRKQKVFQGTSKERERERLREAERERRRRAKKESGQRSESWKRQEGDEKSSGCRIRDEEANVHFLLSLLSSLLSPDTWSRNDANGGSQSCCNAATTTAAVAVAATRS